MRSKSVSYRLKKCISFSFFILVPTGIGIILCAVVIYGGKAVYISVLERLRPITYIASTVEVTSVAESEITGSRPQVQIQPAKTQENAELKAQLIEIPNIFFRDSLVQHIKPVKPYAGNLSLSSPAYLVGDLSTGKIILQKNATYPYPIASLTKLVTASVAKDLINNNEVITIGTHAHETEGDTGKLKLFEKIKAADLYYPLLMVSSNDAAEAFADHYDRNAFLKAMNNKAAAWGAPHTHFYDASGLSAANISTPNDLFKIIQGIYKTRRDVLTITHIKTKSIKGHTWTNPTHFLNLSSYIGGKNGYTEEADRTAISLFSLIGKDGAEHPVVVIVLQSDNRDKDVLNIVKSIEYSF